MYIFLVDFDGKLVGKYTVVPWMLGARVLAKKNRSKNSEKHPATLTHRNESQYKFPNSAILATDYRCVYGKHKNAQF